MNVRPIVLAVIIVACSVLGWIIGRHTVVHLDSQDLPFASQSYTGENNLSAKISGKEWQKQSYVTTKTILHEETLLKGSDIWIDDIDLNKKLTDSSVKKDQVQKTTEINPKFKSSLHHVHVKNVTTSRPKNIQQLIRNITPTTVSRSTSLKVYTHDGTVWKQDSNICNTNENFIKVTLRNSIGYTPIYIHPPNEDIWISRSLQQNGHWEGAFINLVYRLLQEDKDLQFIDLGANIGVFTLSVAKLGRKVIAVEPLSINLQRLCKSVKEGVSIDGEAFAKKVTIIHNALSDVRETVGLGIDRNNVGGTFVLKDSNEKKVQGSTFAGKYKDVVMTAKLDDLLQLPSFDFKKVVLKIDVEGYESKAFNGGGKFFDTVEVKAILMEWRWHTGARDVKSLLDFFVNRKYKAFDPKFQPPTQLDISKFQSWPGDVLWQK